MIIENNLISIVAIGSFNPEILKPKFLTEVCDLKFSEDVKFQSIPNMVSDIKCGNYKFLMDVTRFQISEENIKDFKDTKIFLIMYKYLKTLKYTPLVKLGYNFNVNITNGNALKKINKKINIKEWIEFFKTSGISYTITRVIENSESEIITSFKIKIPKKDNNAINIYFKNMRDKFMANYNYEIGKEDFFKLCKEKESIITIEEDFKKTLIFIFGE